MNPDGSALRRLTQGAEDGAPAWTPNGTKIAFDSSSRDGNYEIYVMNADGSGQTRLTHNSADDRRPSWQPTPRRP
jgi:Tol biopolymer transport system component